MRRSAMALSWALVPATLGQPVIVPIDPALSSVRVELVTDLGSDSDTSPLGGAIELQLDDYTSPAFLTVHDFRIDVLEQIDLEIDIFLIGRVTITGTGVSAFYATPGVPLGPVALEGGNFELLAIPTLLTGILNYEATGLFCTFFQGAGLPCSDSMDLADAGVVLLESLAGTVTVENDMVTVRSSASVSQDVEGIAPVNADGTIVGSAPVPECRADLTGDGQIDADDFFLFLDYFAAGDDRADFDDDGVLDALDFFAFLDAFVEGC